MERLGITKESVSPGGEHSPGLYNRVVAGILLDLDFEDAKTVARLMRDKCEEVLQNVALVEIEMSNIDALEITSHFVWSRNHILADVGEEAI